MHFVLLGAFLFLQYSGIIPYCKKIERNQAGFEGVINSGPSEKGEKKDKKE